MNKQLKTFLDNGVETYNHPTFISSDPISVPHQFTKLQDIEIVGFWVAMLSWGQRKTIINKANELVNLMDGVPHEFILEHSEKDRKKFLNFKHRTFQSTDTLYFLNFLQHYYRNHNSLESAFSRFLKAGDETIEPALHGFHELFFSLPDAPHRTRKHISTPDRQSSCKRLNMFLRWMVRCDDKGVDFGLWKQIRPAQLLLPLDVHVARVAQRLGLLKRKQRDWQAVLELTANLRPYDPVDPAKYDFALFGTGIQEKELRVGSPFI